MTIDRGHYHRADLHQTYPALDFVSPAHVGWLDMLAVGSTREWMGVPSQGIDPFNGRHRGRRDQHTQPE